MARWRRCFVSWLFLVATAARAAEGPLEPDAALREFQLDPGLAVELVAAEPQVIDPVAIRFDQDGRLWVVEMRDYPHGPAEGQKPKSTIRVLEDRDGDGRYEHAQLFAEELLFPTGLQPWQGGVIVTLAGQVAYLKDTDGDGRADARDIWYQGFVEENPQLRANHPRFGIDNRVYVANGLRGGTVVDPRRPEQPAVPISGRDFAFDPRSGDCEAVSGNGQFGNAFDDFGNRFVCNNRQPLDHVVLENRYLARNPLLAVPAVIHNVAAQGDASRVFPLTSAWTTSNLHAGQFTAACGVEMFRGDDLGKDYVGNALVCEPTGSLVHREILRPEGVTFASKMATEGREFLASRDSWFRPVNLETGPDGALYVVDMYRAVIEHPQYMPIELQTRPDLHLGNDRGRIYRVRRKANWKPRRQPRLSQAPIGDVITLLSDKNSWQRETAARLIYERQDRQAVPLLERVALEGQSSVARIGALRALAGLNALSDERLLGALKDADARVREQAVWLTEGRLESEPLLDAALKLATDRDARVCFRTALALGGLSGEKVPEALSRIAFRSPQDPWMQRAVATARPELFDSLLTQVLAVLMVRSIKADDPLGEMLEPWATVVGTRGVDDELRNVLIALDAQPDSSPVVKHVLVGLARGLERRGVGLNDVARKMPLRGRTNWLESALSQADKIAADATLPESERLLSIDLLSHSPESRPKPALVALVATDPSQAIRLGAAAALRPSTADHADALLATYPTQSLAVKRAILDALIARPAAAASLLTTIENGDIARADLDAARENRLRQHADPQVKERAVKLLTTTTPAERKAVLAEYQAALELKADPHAGRELFRKHCSTCHRIGDLGVNVAPDISDSRVKTPSQLLTDILNPNQAIDNNYVGYLVVTTGGATHTGVISAETPHSVTLRQAEDKTVTLLRDEIESMKSTGVSLMPEGFEKSLSVQQVADVISFVKHWRYLDGAAGKGVGLPESGTN